MKSGFGKGGGRRFFFVLLGAIVISVLASPAWAQLDLAPLEKLLTVPAEPTTAPPPPPPPAAPGPATASAAKVGQAPAVLPPVSNCGPTPSPPKLRRSAPRNTSLLVDRVQPLVDYGIPRSQALVLAAPPFPVAGMARFSDDWQNPRTTPCPHLHQGTDIFAAEGTPIVSSGPGTLIAMGRHAVGGISMWVAGDDGNTFYYAHMKKFAQGLKAGQHLEIGTVLGEVGDTGNAEGGAPHLHFQFHPPVKNKRGAVLRAGAVNEGGGLGRTVTPPVNPKPFLDTLLNFAQDQAPNVVQQLLQSSIALPPTVGEAPLVTQSEAASQFELKLAPAPQLSASTKGAASAALGLGVVALVTLLAAMGALGRLWWGRRSQIKRASTAGSAPYLRRPRSQLI